MWYTIQALRQGAGNRRAKAREKISKKVLRNPLTKRSRCGIILRSREKRGNRAGENLRRSLIIEQQEISTSKKASAKSRNSFEKNALSRERQNILFKRISRFRTRFLLVLISCCSIINDLRRFYPALLPRFSRDLRIIPHLLRFVKGFLKTFFENFSKPFDAVCGGCADYYTITFFFCQEVFQKFFELFCGIPSGLREDLSRTACIL